MADWDIVKPLGACSGTGQPIEFGSEYYGALVETDQGLQRQDFSTAFWESEKPDVYCYWRARLPHPDQKKQLFVSDDMLMAFFDRLAEETEQERLNFRFVLTLILMRKRRLKYETSVTVNDQETWTLKVSGGKRLVEVINPHLDEDQIEQLSEQMGQVLNAEL